MSASNGSTRPKRAPPKLDLASILATPPAQTRHEQQQSSHVARVEPNEIIDTHIHLFTRRQLDQQHVKWPLESQHAQLRQPHTLEDYSTLVREAQRSKNTSHFLGAVFVQGERGGCAPRFPPFFVLLTMRALPPFPPSKAEAEHDDNERDGSNGGWNSALDEIDS